MRSEDIRSLLGSTVARLKLKGIGGGALQREGACGLIEFNAENYRGRLLYEDQRNEASDFREVAWPSSVRISVLLSQITNETLISNATCLPEAAHLRDQCETRGRQRQVSMPRMSWATRALQRTGQWKPGRESG